MDLQINKAQKMVSQLAEFTEDLGNQNSAMLQSITDIKSWLSTIRFASWLLETLSSFWVLLFGWGVWVGSGYGKDKKKSKSYGLGWVIIYNNTQRTT